MKSLVLIIFLLSVKIGISQSSSLQIINNAGWHIETPDIMVTHSIGEPIITTLIKPSLVITQGFLQPEDNFVGIDPTWEKALIRIFPNPTSGKFSISYELVNPEPVNIEVFDLSGRSLFQTSRNAAFGRQDIQIEQLLLPKGMYLVNVKTPHSQITERLIIN